MKRIIAIVLISLATALPAFAEDPTVRPKEPASVEAQIRALDQDWARAEDKRDRAALERLLDDNFVFVGSGGGIRDKTGYIQEVLSDDGAQAQTITSAAVHIYRDTAISVGTTTVAIPGEPQSTSYRYTAAYVLRAGQWKTVSCQLAAMKPQSAAP